MLDANAILLEGRVALVTGSGSGIGEAIVETLAAHGAKVVVNDKVGERADAVAKRIQDRGSEAFVCQADVTSSAGIDALQETVAKGPGRVDILVNNVGHFMPGAGPFLRSQESDWDALYDVNFRHILRCTQAFAPGMVERGKGSIISVSTVETLRGIPGNAVYSSFKTAITAFTRSFALEVAPQGVRVNAIAPETTDTEQVPVSRWIPERFQDRVPDLIPLGRFGRPDDHAGAALFLASDLSSWITGTTLPVDGGAMAASGFYRTPEGRWTNSPIVSDNAIQPR